jgi:spectinomycin phosphotransferase
VIVEHPDIPAARVAAVARREWRVGITAAEHVEVGSGAWHWVLGDDTGPQWFASMEAVRTAEERQVRLTAFEAASHLAQRLPFVVAPVPTRDARFAVDVAPGLLLSLTPHLAGEPLGVGHLTGHLTDDVDRAVVASMAGELHRRPRPRRLPVWRPRVGRRGHTERADLERCLAQDDWTGGPWSGPASRLVADGRPVIRQALRRFALLGAAVAGTADRWVVTPSRLHSDNVVRTADGLRLLDWSALALAPRERDLGQALGEADGDDPWYAYVEAGGPPEPLSPDSVELFALQWHLSVIAEHAVLLSRPHDDTPDTRRHFSALEHEVGAVLSRWA